MGDSSPITTEQVYLRHAREVYRWVQRLGRPGSDVEDIVQDVFEVVQKQLAGFRGDASLRTWLYGITVRVVRRQLRSNQRGPVLQGTADQVAGTLAAPDRMAVEQLGQKDLQALVYGILDRMNPRYREVLILFELEGLSGEQIAELEGLTVSAVFVLLHRARRQFQRRFFKLARGERL